jgi:hypothetical protein
MSQRAPHKLKSVASRRCRQPRFEGLERRDLLTGDAPTVVDIEIASTSWAPAFLNYLQTASLGTNGYSIPVGSAAQYSSLSWTSIDQILITFSEDVHVDAADLSLSGINTTVYEFTEFHYDPLMHVAIWTLGSAINKDRLQIDLDANGLDPVRDLDGNILDGEWTNKVSTVSGNGTPGGDFQFLFHVQPADVDNSGRVSSIDAALINQLNGKTTASSGYLAGRDLDGNSLINSTDHQAAVDRYFEERPFGSPVGVNNDAPTTQGFNITTITNSAVDVAVSLLQSFDDAESGGSGLTYSIVSNTNASLFDVASINPTNQLILNAASGISGRANLLIRATDPAGLFTESPITVDVNRENQLPEIQDFYIGSVGYDTWVVSGRVVDPDDDVSEFIVRFYGVFDIRCAVDEEGAFEFAVILDGEGFEYEYAITTDPHGLSSPEVFQGLTLT